MKNVTTLDLVHKHSIPTEFRNGHYEYYEYKDEQQRREAAKPWFSIIKDIEQSEKLNRADAAEAFSVYLNKQGRKRIPKNIFQRNTKVAKAFLKPKAIRPDFSYYPTNNEMQDKASQEVADIIQLKLQRLMDNGALDTPAADALEMGLVSGKSMIRTYLYQYKNKPNICWEPMDYDQMYIPPVKSFDRIPFIIQEHFIPNVEASVYMGNEAYSHRLRKQGVRNSYTTKQQMDKKQDGYIVYEVFQLKPTPRHFWLREHDQMLLDEALDPYPEGYDIPSFFPYSRPFIPLSDCNMSFISPYVNYRDLHQLLQLLCKKLYDNVEVTALKYLASADSKVLDQWIMGTEPGMHKDPNLKSVLSGALGSNPKLEDILVKFPIEDQYNNDNHHATLIQFITSQIDEISGIAEILRGAESATAKTATEEAIKQRNAELSFSDLFIKQQNVIRDTLQISAELIHRYMGQNPEQLAYEMGRTLNLQEPDDALVAEFLANPDRSTYIYDVEPESLRLLDQETNRANLAIAMELMRDYMATAPTIGPEPQDNLMFHKLYKSLFEEVDLNPTSKKPFIEIVETAIDSYNEIIEAEKQDPSLTQQREEHQRSIEQEDPEIQKVLTEQQKLKDEQQYRIQDLEDRKLQRQHERELSDRDYQLRQEEFAETKRINDANINKINQETLNSAADTETNRVQADASVMNAEAKQKEVDAEIDFQKENLRLKEKQIDMGKSPTETSSPEIE